MKEDGFTLIEALVALAVLAIATVGLVGALEAHVDSTRAMERRSAATWVAQNRLAELNLGGAAVGGDRAAMLDGEWRIATDRRPTDDPEIERVTIRVFAGNDTASTASLDGFVAVPPREGRR